MTDHAALALQPIDFDLCSVPFALFVRSLTRIHNTYAHSRFMLMLFGASNSFSFMRLFFSPLFSFFPFPSFWWCFSFYFASMNNTCLFYYIPFLYISYVSSVHCIESKRCNHMKWNLLLVVILLIFVN